MMIVSKVIQTERSADKESCIALCVIEDQRLGAEAYS